MANIVFYISKYQSEFNATLKLAKKLQSIGHQVFYIGLSDYEEKVCRQGFSFLPILEKWFPKGFTKDVESTNLTSSKLKLIVEQLKYLKTSKNLVHSLLKGKDTEIQTLLKAINPDLLLISTGEVFESILIGLIAYECKITSIYLTDMFTSLPPNLFLKNIEPNISNNFNLITKAKNLFSTLIGLYLNEKILIKSFAVSRNIPLELLDLSQEVRFKLPHLFLCPEELDFPQVSREKCYYAEASIDLQREEPPFSWSKLNNDKHLIYCTLGTTAETFASLGVKNIKIFFQTIIDAISLKQEYQLVISVGEYIGVEDFPYIPANVIIVNKAPQLALLKKASLAIIAGGVRTLKECIFWEVPMIVFPIWADQPENAERIKHHGLGIVGDIKNVSINHVNDLLEKIENDCLLKQKVKLFGEKFRKIEDSERAIKFILGIVEKDKSFENI
jgi:zeaxanthin glucosyltransferase